MWGNKKLFRDFSVPPNIASFTPKLALEGPQIQPQASPDTAAVRLSLIPDGGSLTLFTVLQVLLEEP